MNDALINDRLKVFISPHLSKIMHKPIVIWKIEKSAITFLKSGLERSKYTY